jgi:hypothetical protein
MWVEKYTTLPASGFSILIKSVTNFQLVNPRFDNRISPGINNGLSLRKCLGRINISNKLKSIQFIPCYFDSIKYNKHFISKPVCPVCEDSLGAGVGLAGG